jgi:cell division protein FtsW (lipid II flippase)
MRTLQTTATALPQVHKAGILWKRVIVAAIGSEFAVIIVISLIMVTHMVLTPGQTKEEYSEFGQNAGYYAAAPAATLAVFLMAFWAIRKLDSDFIINGLLVGTIATLLTLGFIVSARPGDRWMYIASFVLRIAAGYAAGMVVQRMKGQPQ